MVGEKALVAFSPNRSSPADSLGFVASAGTPLRNPLLQVAYEHPLSLRQLGWPIPGA